jgi:putative SOS response-associated peptidase YedK
MCGRFTFAVSTERMRNAFPWLNIQESISPRWNIAPSQAVLAALNDGTYETSTAKWGLIPSWERALNGGRKPINARIETLAESRLFAPLLRRKRCAIFADGFYEWATEDGKKIPYHFRLQGLNPTFVSRAAIWEKPDEIRVLGLLRKTVLSNNARLTHRSEHEIRLRRHRKSHCNGQFRRNGGW